MEIPAGFEVSEQELKVFGVQNKKNLVLKLNKSLYGLKQAGRLWNQMMDSFLIENGYRKSVTDKCLYFKLEQERIVIIGLYVDDLLVIGTCQKMVDELFQIAAKMDIKNLGQASKVLGMRVVQDDDGVTFDQESMIEDFLEKHGLKTANPKLLPISANYDEVKDGELLPSSSTTKQPVYVQVYQSIVGRSRVVRDQTFFSPYTLLQERRMLRLRRI
jgi:hypothetical protein